MSLKTDLIKVLRGMNVDELPGCGKEKDSVEAREEALLFLSVARTAGYSVDDKYREVWAALTSRHSVDFKKVTEYLKQIQASLKEP